MYGKHKIFQALSVGLQSKWIGWRPSKSSRTSSSLLMGNSFVDSVVHWNNGDNGHSRSGTTNSSLANNFVTPIIPPVDHHENAQKTSSRKKQRKISLQLGQKIHKIGGRCFTPVLEEGQCWCSLHVQHSSNKTGSFSTEVNITLSYKSPQDPNKIF